MSGDFIRDSVARQSASAARFGFVPQPEPPAPAPEPTPPEPSPAGALIPPGPRGGTPSGDLIRDVMRRRPRSKG
jgi:hypothetical protein